MRRWFGSVSPQQRLMQHLFRMHDGVPEAVCLAYVEAERDGRVGRPCGAEFMTPRTHADLLLQEGKLKGWLRMRASAPRSMTFNVRPVADGQSDTRWQWTVYEEPHGCFVRNGQVTGDREKAERAARAAIAIMGGRLVDDVENR